MNVKLKFKDSEFAVALADNSLTIVSGDSGKSYTEMHDALVHFGESNRDVVISKYPNDMSIIAHEGQTLFGFGSPHIHECGWKVRYEFDTHCTKLIVEGVS